MGIFNIFSKRQKILRGECPDVYQYTDIPPALRVQIVHIWHNIGNFSHYCQSIVQALRNEYGVFKLLGADVDHNMRSYVDYNYANELINTLLIEKSYEKCLDIIELSFSTISSRCGDNWTNPDEAIDELNFRFKEHGVGYQFINGEIIRVDSQYIHSEVVKPAFHLLNEQNFKGAEEEFLKAHEYYRHGNHKGALVECLKAFESVMKSICHQRKWVTEKTPTAHKLIAKCLEMNLIPAIWQSFYTGLRSTLESGVPTARNQWAGHGAGLEPTEVPAHIAAYVLHMTASAIVFLCESNKCLD